MGKLVKSTTGCYEKCIRTPNHKVMSKDPESVEL